MRLLAITNCFPRSFKDTRAPWNRQQFLALARHHSIRLVVPVPFTQRGIRTDRSELDWSASGDLRAVYPTFWFTPRCLQQHYGPLMLRSIQPAVDRILQQFVPDAVLGCWAHPDGYAAVQIARQLGVPALLKVIGTDVLILGQNKKRRPCIASTLRGANGVFAVSRDLANHVIEMGVAPAKVHVIPEGIDASIFHPGEQSAARQMLGLSAQAKIILIVGNLLLSKGAAVLLKACSVLRNRGIHFTCCLVGAGRDEVYLQSLASTLKLGNQVVFVGCCSQARLGDWYRAADLVALPSFSEGIPNTLREAICCGRPFVATDVGGIPEISPPQISRLIPPGDVPALVTALEELLEKPPAVPAALAAKYCMSWEDSAGKVGALLEKLVTEAPLENQAFAELPS